MQAASPSLTPDSQQLDAHVLTSAAAEGLARNMQREDNLIFGLLHTFWEVGSRTSSLLSPPPLSIMLLACSNSSNRVFGSFLNEPKPEMKALLRGARLREMNSIHTP